MRADDENLKIYIRCFTNTSDVNNKSVKVGSSPQDHKQNINSSRRIQKSKIATKINYKEQKEART